MTSSRPAPLRPLGTAEILDGAVRLVRADTKPVLSIALPFAVVYAGLSAALRLALTHASDATILVFLLGDVVVSGLGVALTALLAPLFTARLLGNPIDGRTALRGAGRRSGGLLVLALAVVVGEGAGLGALLVAGIWLWGMWAVAAPAMVLEKHGPFGALRRSFRLVRGSFWRVWGLRALGSVLTGVLTVFIVAPFDALASVLGDVNPFDGNQGLPNSGLFVLVTSLGSLVAATVVLPLSSAIDLLLYTDLRMRREGMDIVLALPAAPLGAGGPPAPAARTWGRSW